jgi:hypothetical protein
VQVEDVGVHLGSGVSGSVLLGACGCVYLRTCTHRVNSKRVRREKLRAV